MLGQPLYLAVPNPEEGGIPGFGGSVAGYGDDILVGDTFRSKVYLLDGDTGAVLRTFVSPGTNDGFGAALAVVGTDVWIGAPGNDTVGVDMGAVHLFDGSTGALQLTVHHPGPDYVGAFGAEVAVAGSNLLVAARGLLFSVAGKVFLLDGSTGAVLQTYLNPSADTQNSFGVSVAAVGAHVVVGAMEESVTAAYEGAAYVFDAATGAHVQTLNNPNPAPQTYFGYLLAPFGPDVLVGSFFGFAYRFDPVTGTALTTYPFAAINSIGTHAGNVLLSIANGDIRVLDPVSGATVRSYANFQTIILDALASSVGNRVVAVSNDQHFQNRWGAVFSFCGGPTECGPCETCDASGACVAAPHPTCRALTSGRSTLVVKDMTPNDKDRVLWKIGGAFPDPPRNSPGFAFGFPDYALGENDYTLCMYDESTLTPSVVFRATAPVAGDCGGSPCWKAVRYGVFGDVSGYTYLDREQTPHGLEKILLRTTGGGGSLRLKVQGKGDNLSSAPLGMVTPPFNLPLRVQLHNRYGSCWEATYPAARRNVPGQFRATASTP